MYNLLIIGAGGCGREVLQWAKDMNKSTSTWNIKGFLDDNADALTGLRCDVSVVGSTDNYIPQVDDRFVCCIGNSCVRKSIIEKMESKGAVFANIIHPTAIVCDSALLGKATILYPYSIISDNAVLGDGCIINMHSTIAHDSILGEFCTVSAHCDVTGMCKLGDRVFMGSGSRTVPSARVGNDVFICAGSTVMSRIKAGMKVIGVPAKKVMF
ncbi:MAG: acetyltransferase [Ruminococcus sp.]|jgi:sugar O-acyltransferase (sialic acid O-acetyltransferase NeuD family)|nr:acetyltransferase [Ruminococcus sp.]